jgi:hypothetical protein
LNAVAAPIGDTGEAITAVRGAGRTEPEIRGTRPLLPRRRGRHDLIDLGELSASSASDGSELAPGHREIAVEYQGGVRLALSDQALLARPPSFGAAARLGARMKPGAPAADAEPAPRRSVIWQAW